MTNIKIRNIFLDNITSKKNKYKRVSLSPIRYIGGKSLAVGHIIEKLPDNISKVISPFFGGGSVELAMNKHLGIEVKGFDIFNILTNYWDYQIKSPEVLYNRLSELNPDKKTFLKVREDLKQHWKNTKKLNMEDLAVYFFYNFSLSYGPHFLGSSSDIYFNNDKYNRLLNKVKNFSVNNLSVECKDFEEVIKNNNNNFLYLDPPYYIGEGSDVFCGCYPRRGEAIYHDNFNHEKLANLLYKHKGGFILSYNNCQFIKDLYKDFEQSFPTWQYTLGQGETRIGNQRNINNSNYIKKSSEILICG